MRMADNRAPRPSFDASTAVDAEVGGWWAHVDTRAGGGGAEEEEEKDEEEHPHYRHPPPPAHPWMPWSRPLGGGLWETLAA
eukprot:5764841-Pyramimonas_sp.AAC.1